MAKKNFTWVHFSLYSKCFSLIFFFLLSVSPAQRLIHTANISTQVVTDKQAKFKVKPKFLEVLRSLPSTDQKKTIFTYEEVSLAWESFVFLIMTVFVFR